MGQQESGEDSPYILAQVAIALGDENRWYAGERVGHDPTPDECMEHFYLHGGADAFRQQNSEAFKKTILT